MHAPVPAQCVDCGRSFTCRHRCDFGPCDKQICGCERNSLNYVSSLGLLPPRFEFDPDNVLCNTHFSLLKSNIERSRQPTNLRDFVSQRIAQNQPQPQRGAPQPQQGARLSAEPSKYSEYSKFAARCSSNSSNSSANFEKHFEDVKGKLRPFYESLQKANYIPKRSAS